MESYITFVVKGTFAVFLGRLISTLIAYLLRIYLARELSLADYGVLYASISFLTSIFTFRDLGLSTALARFVPEAVKQGKPELARAYLKCALLVHFLLTALICLPLILFADPIATFLFHNPTASNVLRILALGTLLSFYSLAFTAFLRGRKRILPYATFNVVYVLATLISLNFLFSFAKNAVVASVGFALGSVIAGAYVAFFAIKALPSSGRAKHELRQVLRSMLSFGLMAFLISLFLTLLGNFDTLLLAMLRSASEAGYYQVAVPTARLILFFASSLTAVLLPVLSELWAKRNVQLLSKAMHLLLKFVCLAAIPLALWLFLFAEPIILIFFGQNYAEASIALKFLSLAYFFYTLAQINLTCSMALNELKRTARFVGLALMANLLLNSALIPSLGILGASFTALITFVLLFLLTTIDLKLTFLGLKGKLELPSKAILLSFLAAVATAILVKVLQVVIALALLPKLFILSSIALIVYSLLLLLSGAVGGEDVKVLNKMVAKRRENSDGRLEIP